MSSGFVKRALRREPGYPIGKPAPMYLLCGCGNHLAVTDGQQSICLCGIVYDDHGWILSEEVSA